MKVLVVPTCTEPTVALEPATKREIPCPLRLANWVVELVDANASSVTVPDCAPAFPGHTRSAAATIALHSPFSRERLMPSSLTLAIFIFRGHLEPQLVTLRAHYTTGAA